MNPDRSEPSDHTSSAGARDTRPGTRLARLGRGAAMTGLATAAVCVGLVLASGTPIAEWARGLMLIAGWGGVLALLHGVVLSAWAFGRGDIRFAGLRLALVCAVGAGPVNLFFAIGSLYRQ